MSRYRPPSPKSSPYVTQQGFDKLQAELKYLWQTKRPEVTRKVAEAAALGDRSENAEYIYGKKQLREIDARVRYISKRLDALKVIDRVPDEPERIFFGAEVTLEDDTGTERTFRIVGADEIDMAPEYISIDAPLARALIGKRIDDEISVQEQTSARPRVHDPSRKAAMLTYVVVDIRYPTPS